MTALAEKKCVACEESPAVSESEARKLLDQLDSWELHQPKDGARIEKSFKFDGFMPGVDFVNKVARLAEDEGHHPDIFLKWGEVRITLWTHSAKGLTENDFILAAKIDRLDR